MVQTGLLTPLTFAQHRLSSLTAFTSNAYFLHNGRWWQWICKFYTANFKEIFWGLQSECVLQQAITCCLCYRIFFFFFLGCPKIKKLSANLPSSGQPRNNAKTLFSHPPSPFTSNFCNCNSGGICTASQFYVQLPLLYTAWSNAYSEIGPEVTLQPLATSCAKDYKGHSFV